MARRRAGRPVVPRLRLPLLRGRPPAPRSLPPPPRTAEYAVHAWLPQLAAAAGSQAESVEGASSPLSVRTLDGQASCALSSPNTFPRGLTSPRTPTHELGCSAATLAFGTERRARDELPPLSPSTGSLASTASDSGAACAVALLPPSEDAAHKLSACSELRRDRNGGESHAARGGSKLQTLRAALRRLSARCAPQQLPNAKQVPAVAAPRAAPVYHECRRPVPDATSAECGAHSPPQAASPAVPRPHRRGLGCFGRL